MKKRILLSVLLCCALCLTMLAACDSGGTPADSTPPPSDDGGNEATPSAPSAPKTVYTIDFTDGKTDFLFINKGTPDTDPDTLISVGDADGGKALEIKMPNGDDARIGINVGGLLGSAASNVKTVVVDVYADFPDGRFNTVAGEMGAYSGDLTNFKKSSWAMTSENFNPLQIIYDLGDGFPTGGPNIIEFACTKNGPAEKGDTPAVVYIKGITFYDESNTGLAVDTSVSWAGPEGYGEAIKEQQWELPVSGAVESGEFYEYYTWGFDEGNGVMSGPDGKAQVGTDDYMPWEMLRMSHGIVFETANPVDLEVAPVFICFGAYNGWGWTQSDAVYTYEDGKMTILWEENGFDPLLVNETDWAVKLRFGYWGVVIYEHTTAAYLIYYE